MPSAQLSGGREGEKQNANSEYAYVKWVDDGSPVDVIIIFRFSESI